ncbi:MAG TPA: NAD(P)/FAD-dependent oxidoreductase [Acidimicrobiales bacterium]|nr:NAD(P)/FAD-dependent oxidoreductase [Acidimicrobiales bacterium]
MITADVVVVGGGPAGSATAITLARAGRRVVVVDRARFPRDKCCGDGLTAGALRRLESLGLRPAAVPSWQPVRDICLRGPAGRTVRFPLPAGPGLYAAVARRADLDAALLDVAREAGVEVIEGARMRSATVAGSGDHVRLTVEGVGALAARYVVGADGMWSPLRKALGGEAGGYLGEWHAFRQYFTDVAPAAAAALWVWFDADLLPGYAWSFPLPDGGANVGFGMQRVAGEATGAMKELWPDLLARPHIRDVLGPDARPESPHKAWPIPAQGGADLAAAGGRALFVGDAARVADPMTGEGIGQALETGMLAARAIVASGALDPGGAAGSYRRAVAEGLARDNRLAAVLSRHGIAHRKGVRLSLRLAGSSAWSRRHFGRWLFEDEPRAILATPHRWHGRLFHRPGAFG